MKAACLGHAHAQFRVGIRMLQQDNATAMLMLVCAGLFAPLARS